ncbi:restriction endonuclease subunit S [Enterococcus faecium]|nr:restriction endonuclease subunit S [Enterococcus faecium]EGP4984428.1 restriction endonuclease subunit S [Enterococcus faecium]EGP5086794.1 restriction endonuclease subunit S [Enterococcus faecium]EGP5140260.1 restriction endonuclease subunit S [Enterococcus faecium]EME3546020.1 restriction endonuclease subunit S [Enterococcus faecium]EME7138510.1 restriction endonuclease subunit S [Enterococcus faecium]
MQEERTNVPKIRFKGYAEEWEERKFESLLDKKDGIRRGPFGSALKKEFFVSESEYVVYEQQNAIYDNYETRYNITKEKFEELSKFELKPTDFIMSGAGTIGRISKVPNGINKGVFNQALIRFRINKSITDSEYFVQFVRADFMQRKLTGANSGSAITNLVPMSEVKNWIIKVPKINEQQKIGSFFKQLDDTITLHQRKLDLLKETKKGFLQKMFPKNGAKVPEIRFPGFTEDWEQRKLGEVVERVTRKNKKLESIRPLTISAQEGLIDQNEFFNKTVASRDVSGYYLVKKGEFAYNKSYSNGYPWGAVKRLNQYDMGVLSTLYIVFKPKKIDSDFLEKYYDTTYWYKEVSKHAAEGARNHGLLNIAASDFFETEIVMPLKIEEQQKIGNFFKQLDDTIALHQRELDSLKEMKKSLLQQMFV